MMINVKKTMDKWRKLFIKQAHEDDQKLGLSRETVQKLPRPMIHVESKEEASQLDDSSVLRGSPVNSKRVDRSIKSMNDMDETIEKFQNSMKE
jgi:hypothetical protein